jgi:hypothetical protein
VALARSRERFIYGLIPHRFGLERGSWVSPVPSLRYDSGDLNATMETVV